MNIFFNQLLNEILIQICFNAFIIKNFDESNEKKVLILIVNTNWEIVLNLRKYIKLDLFWETFNFKVWITYRVMHKMLKLLYDSLQHKKCKTS